MSLCCCLSYKDTILKANHSSTWEFFILSVLLLILQRYYFESESQLEKQAYQMAFCCCLSYKDTILKANHSKIKLIQLQMMLLLILQRYYFESESQLVAYLFHTPGSCCLSYKDTILKANHSAHPQNGYPVNAVAYPTKILFWKRITALSNVVTNVFPLLLILQRYYFESESQHGNRILWRHRCCCLSYKDTILKANHSLTRVRKLSEWLLLILQRYYFESESQRRSPCPVGNRSCCLSYKDTILKANHSPLYRSPTTPLAVAYPTKILFWKRITAAEYNYFKDLLLLLILQRYYFESESQLVFQSHFHFIAVAYPTKILFWKRITATFYIYIS